MDGTLDVSRSLPSWGGSWLEGGRPRWFNPWLGFAAYDAVATLLWLALYAMSGIMDRAHWAIVDFLVFALFLLPFAPYFAAAVWVGWRRSLRLLAVYTVFPTPH